MTTGLSRTAASAAVTGLGWRLVLGELRTWIPVTSLAHAAEVAAQVVAACGDDANAHVRIDLHSDRVAVAVQSLATGG